MNAHKEFEDKVRMLVCEYWQKTGNFVDEISIFYETIGKKSNIESVTLSIHVETETIELSTGQH